MFVPKVEAKLAVPKRKQLDRVKVNRKISYLFY